MWPLSTCSNVRGVRASWHCALQTIYRLPHPIERQTESNGESQRGYSRYGFQSRWHGFMETFWAFFEHVDLWGIAYTYPHSTTTSYAITFHVRTPSAQYLLLIPRRHLLSAMSFPTRPTNTLIRYWLLFSVHSIVAPRFIAARSRNSSDVCQVKAVRMLAASGGIVPAVGR